VEVQSPLTVTPHIMYTPLDEHQRLVQDLRDHREATDRRLQEMSNASSASRQKIYDLIREQAARSDALARETATKVDQVSGQVTVINQQLQQISVALITK
jgi:predicted Rossmann fold nucleotide-binding protein DprA/Smf involved in DNA uptake